MTAPAIKNIFAVGAGAMGSFTALCFAMGGYTVRLYDLNDAAIELGMKNIKGALETYKAHGVLTQATADIALGKITTTTTLEDAKDADLIIESIVENLKIKQEVFGKLDAICPAHTIFATNTSGLSPTAIAESLNRKDKFVVTHFWNPPHLLPLVEVVPGEHTSKETVDAAFDLMVAIGKKPVRLSRECPGFLGNRLQLALLREALYLVESGIATPDDIDTVVEYSLGRRLSVTGPLRSADLGGLDVFRNIFSYLGADLCSATGIPELLQQTVDAGKLGAKSGQGLYAWKPEELEALKNRRVEELFRHLKGDYQDRAAKPAA